MKVNKYKDCLPAEMNGTPRGRFICRSCHHDFADHTNFPTKPGSGYYDSANLTGLACRECGVDCSRYNKKHNIAEWWYSENEIENNFDLITARARLGLNDDGSKSV